MVLARDATEGSVVANLGFSKARQRGEMHQLAEKGKTWMLKGGEIGGGGGGVLGLKVLSIGNGLTSGGGNWGKEGKGEGNYCARAGTAMRDGGANGLRDAGGNTRGGRGGVGGSR